MASPVQLGGAAQEPSPATWDSSSSLSSSSSPSPLSSASPQPSPWQLLSESPLVPSALVLSVLVEVVLLPLQGFRPKQVFLSTLVVVVLELEPSALFLSVVTASVSVFV
ncbi:hypothetical protein D9M70_593870 [compost metagenome]